MSYYEKFTDLMVEFYEAIMWLDSFLCRCRNGYKGTDSYNAGIIDNYYRIDGSGIPFVLPMLEDA